MIFYSNIHILLHSWCIVNHTIFSCEVAIHHTSPLLFLLDIIRMSYIPTGAIHMMYHVKFDLLLELPLLISQVYLFSTQAITALTHTHLLSVLVTWFIQETENMRY